MNNFITLRDKTGKLSGIKLDDPVALVVDEKGVKLTQSTMTTAISGDMQVSLDGKQFLSLEAVTPMLASRFGLRRVPGLHEKDYSYIHPTKVVSIESNGADYSSVHFAGMSHDTNVVIPATAEHLSAALSSQVKLAAVKKSTASNTSYINLAHVDGATVYNNGKTCLLEMNLGTENHYNMAVTQDATLYPLNVQIAAAFLQDSDGDEQHYTSPRKVAYWQAEGETQTRVHYTHGKSTTLDLSPAQLAEKLSAAKPARGEAAGSEMLYGK